MFIRLKGLDAEINLNVAQIQSFTPAPYNGDVGSVVTLVDGEEYTVKETNRVIRKLISEAGSPQSED